MHSLEDSARRLAGEKAKTGAKRVSFYLPTKGRTQDKIKKHLKSELTTLAKNHGYKKGFKQLSEKAENKIGQMDLQGSVALFATLDKNQVVNMELLALPLKVTKKSTVGKIYDLTQLAGAAYLKDILLVSVTATNARAWQLLNSKKQNKLFDIENEDVKKWELEKNYLDRYSPTRQDSAVYSTGKDKVDRLIKESSRRFLNKIKEKITNKNKNKYNYAIIYHTKNITELVEELADGLKNYLKPEFVLTIDNHFDNPIELINNATKKVKEEIEKIHKSYLTEAKNSPKPYVSGWKDVAEVASEMRIEKLFIPSDKSKKGYVVEDRILSTYPVKNSKATSNLAAWISRSAINTNSDIIMVESKKPSAILRY